MRRFHRNGLSVLVVVVFAWTSMAIPQVSTPIAVPYPIEPIPIKPICDNCRMEGGVIYECAHFTLNPEEPCLYNMCIENRWISAVCDYHPEGDRNFNLCAAIDSSNPADWLVQQQLRWGYGCFTTDLGDYHEIMRLVGDCRSCPNGTIVLSGRCVTDGAFCAAGLLLETSYRGVRRICGCIPSPDDPIRPNP